MNLQEAREKLLDAIHNYSDLHRLMTVPTKDAWDDVLTSIDNLIVAVLNDDKEWQELYKTHHEALQKAAQEALEEVSSRV